MWVIEHMHRRFERQVMFGAAALSGCNVQRGAVPRCSCKCSGVKGECQMCRMPNVERTPNGGALVGLENRLVRAGTAS